MFATTDLLALNALPLIIGGIALLMLGAFLLYRSDANTEFDLAETAFWCILAVVMCVWLFWKSAPSPEVIRPNEIAADSREPDRD